MHNGGNPRDMDQATINEEDGPNGGLGIASCMKHKTKAWNENFVPQLRAGLKCANHLAIQWMVREFLNKLYLISLWTFVNKYPIS